MVDPRYWGIVAILVVGTAVVLYGALADRAATKRLREQLAAPPSREIPKFSPRAEAPRYLSELEGRQRPAGSADAALTEDERVSLRDRLVSATKLPATLPDGAFITDAATNWCVLESPRVLVIADEVDSIRELLGALEQAQAGGRPLVLVAAGFHADVIATLLVNHVQGKVTCLPLTLAGADRESVCELTGAESLTSEDLKSGYLPATAWGAAAVWVSDARGSHVVM